MLFLSLSGRGLVIAEVMAILSAAPYLLKARIALQVFVGPDDPISLNRRRCERHACRRLVLPFQPPKLAVSSGQSSTFMIKNNHLPDCRAHEGALRAAIPDQCIHQHTTHARTQRQHAPAHECSAHAQTSGTQATQLLARTHTKLDHEQTKNSKTGTHLANFMYRPKAKQ